MTPTITIAIVKFSMSLLLACLSLYMNMNAGAGWIKFSSFLAMVATFGYCGFVGVTL